MKSIRRPVETWNPLFSADLRILFITQPVSITQGNNETAVDSSSYSKWQFTCTWGTGYPVRHIGRHAECINQHHYNWSNVTGSDNLVKNNGLFRSICTDWCRFKVNIKYQIWCMAQTIIFIWMLLIFAPWRATLDLSVCHEHRPKVRLPDQYFVKIDAIYFKTINLSRCSLHDAYADEFRLFPPNPIEPLTYSVYTLVEQQEQTCPRA